MAIPAIGPLRLRDLTMGEESSHYEQTPSTWTLAKDDPPDQFEAAHSFLQRRIKKAPPEAGLKSGAGDRGRTDDLMLGKHTL